MLRFDNDEPFSTGMATYLYRPATAEETSPRILLQIQVGEQLISAFVDTGSPYFLCDPEVASTLGLSPEDALGSETIRFRKERLNGKIHRFPVIFLAEAGENLPVEATMFVPDLTNDQVWGDFPSIIGLSGCLERLRFAVDPSNDRFYFGALP